MKKILESLEALTQINQETHTKLGHLNPCDSIQKLSFPKISGWRRILSSVATTESVERTLMTPLEEAFSKNPEILNYLASHQQDETRHHELLNRYLKNTFQYVKSHRTLSDQVIYDQALPQVSKIFKTKPLYGLAMLSFFEVYGINFYRNFKQQAQADGLRELARVVEQIEKDEIRHLRGLDLLLQYYFLSGGKLTWLDQKAIAACLKLLVLDVNMTSWAIHNREVRSSAIKIELDPKQLTQGARSAAKQIQSKMRNHQKEILR